VLSSSSCGNVLFFQGRVRDRYLGLYNFRNRYYSPGLGRFVQVDPIREAGGLNLYRFVANNPVSLSDPDGRSIIVIVIGVAALWEYFCARYAADKAAETFPGNDKKQHCMASCLHNRCTLLGSPHVTFLGGVLWELRRGGVFDWGDIVADAYGTGASYNLFQSCRDSCDQYQCPVQ
jgi:RHS repeat-associated protein